MSDLARSWHALGYGTDPAGDAARREKLSGAHVGGGRMPSFLRRALAAEAARVTEEARRALPADQPDPEEPEEVPGHRLERTRNGTATVVRCECGRWDGAWTGPRSRRRVMDDHAEHVAAELRAAGPLRVKAERLDTPPALPPGETS